MKILQKFQLFQGSKSYKTPVPNGSGSIIHSLSINVYVSKALNVGKWDPCIEIKISEEKAGKNDSQIYEGTYLLDCLNSSDIDTIDYAIGHFKPAGMENFKSAPILFFLSNDLIFELETKSQTARLLTKGCGHELTYVFPQSDDLKNFVTTLRDAIKHIDDFLKSVGQKIE
jgi:hypothetical protein